MNPYQDLLDRRLSSEEFVRQGLDRLETDIRRLAIAALADWDFLQRPDPALMTVLAALRRPSFGVMNQLLIELDAATTRLTSADDGGRLIKLVDTLDRTLTILRQPAGEEIAKALQPLAEFTRVAVPSHASFGRLLALPTCLSYRMHQEAPTDVRWWSWAGNALAPLIQVLATDNVFAQALGTTTFPTPWFFHDQRGETWTFYGLSRARKVRYISDDHRVRREAGPLKELHAAYARLLGRDELPDGELRVFLGRIARREFIGLILGDFLVGAPLARGTRSAIHAGRQLSTGRRVAVKVLDDDVDDKTRRRFLTAAEALADVDHPCVTRVAGFGDEKWIAPRNAEVEGDWLDAFSGAESKTFAALEWVAGPTFEELLAAGKSGRPGLDSVIDWFEDAAEGLAKIHEAGHVHGDIHPSSLVAAHASAQIRDNVSARDPSREEDARSRLDVYLAPELMREEEPADPAPAADVYSLCAVFYEMLTGRRLYGHNTLEPYQVRNLKLTGVSPPEPRALNPSITEELETILLGGLRTEPEERYQSGADLLRELRDMREGRRSRRRLPSDTTPATAPPARAEPGRELEAGEGF